MEQRRSLATLGRLRDRLSGLTRRSSSATSSARPVAPADDRATGDRAIDDPVTGDRARPSAPNNLPADALTARLTGLEWVFPDRDDVDTDDADTEESTREESGAWGTGPRLRIEGFAWRRGGVGRGARVAAVQLTTEDAERSGDDPVAGRTVTASLRPVSSAAYNDYSRYPEEDRSDTGFVAVVEAAQLQPMGDPDRVQQLDWRVSVSVTDSHGTVTRGFTQRDESGSAGRANSCDIGSGCLAQTAWGKGGLKVSVARRAVSAEQVDLTGGRVQAIIRCRDFLPTTAFLRRGDDVVELELTALDSPGRYRLSGPVTGLADGVHHSRSWYLYLADADGASRHVHWQAGASAVGDDRLPGFRMVDPDDERVAVRYGPNGVLRIDIHPERSVIDAVSILPASGSEPELLRIEGEGHGLSADPDRWQLHGGRHRFMARTVSLAEGRFIVDFALSAVGPWAGRATALPTAEYELQLDTVQGTVAALVSPAFSRLGEALPGDANKIVIARTPSDHLLLRVGAPRVAGERSGYTHRQFQIMHRTARIEPTDTVFFDSFDGMNAADNSRAVFEELRRRRPDLRALWTVTDLSVELPADAEPLIIKSEAWWRALTSSRLIVTNCWLPQAFVRRDHQRVLQTWHGTPLKLLGFDRLGTKRGRAYHDRTVREVAQWDLLVSQNPYSTRIFRSAYDYRGEVLEIGYPRDDVLNTATDRDRAAIRARLGLAADERVVLYVPTWRDDAKGLFSRLDFGAVAAALNDHRTGRLLVRGHVNTIRHGSGVAGDRILDVTLYPELAELYLIADVMITDYSSTMFDFSITGKPMIFFAPDIEQYSGSQRGTYFDLTGSAPGPIVATTAQVIAELHDLAAVRSRYAQAYAIWRSKFNPYDDGAASRRAVDALLGGGR